MKRINKMVYFLLIVSAFVIASFMTETGSVATGEKNLTETISGVVLSVDAESSNPSLTIELEGGDIEISVDDKTVISENKTLKDINNGDNVNVRYSMRDMRNIAEVITVEPAMEK